jgi:hypothetical protein
LDPHRCSYEEDQKVIEIDPSILFNLANGNLSFQYEGPSFLSFERPQTTLNVAMAGISTTGNPVPFTCRFPVILQSSALALNGKLRVNFSGQVTKGILYDYLKFYQEVDTSKPVSGEFCINISDFTVKEKTPEMFQPFDYTVTVFSNGEAIASGTVRTSLPDIMEQYLVSALNQIPSEAFKSPYEQRLSAFENMIQSMAQKLRESNVNGARQQLENDIMAKCDGENGGTPNDDWIIDSYWRNDFYSILHKVDNLQSQMQ